MHCKYLFVLALLVLGASCAEAATFNLTSVHLGCMFSNLLAGTVSQALPKLQTALGTAGISSREQAAAFFTVIGYTGRGALMLSGLLTYSAAKINLGVDFVGSPDSMTTIDNRYLVAGWYWKSLGHSLLNTFSDATWALIALAYRDDMGQLIPGSTLADLYPTMYACLQPDTSCSWYVTVTGDTPNSIAKARNLSVSKLMTLNGWTNANAVLTAGESIKLWCSS